MSIRNIGKGKKKSVFTSTFSTTEWWIASVVSGIALAVAMQSLVITRRHKLMMVLPPLAGAAFIVLSSAARGHEGETPLMLFTATALGLAIMRLVFAVHLRRQMELVRSGQPMKQLTVLQVVIFFLAFAAVVMSMAVFL
ncbi:hypothetical protein [Streptomyces peucetius]|uniref:DUF202 domain-containing protein n=1 Tax=Streptomyces peucetius TaxID=1950 RepID=A0ABY6I0D7_STRPE|nr:hypothetical protein [Streptomyces peucetius]UYQ60434.1 hypothetical protein OGH68_02355 [Streptomyces peucetius]